MAKKTNAAAVVGVAESVTEKLYDVDELSRKYSLPDYEKTGIRKLRGWLAGKRVTDAEFKTARSELLGRRF